MSMSDWLNYIRIARVNGGGTQNIYGLPIYKLKYQPRER
jgi:hypothetical protein